MTASLYPAINSDKLKELIIFNITHSLFTPNAIEPSDIELNEKIKNAYPNIKRSGYAVPILLTNSLDQDVYATYEAVAQEVCNKLGLRFHNSLANQQTFTKKDFAMLVIDLKEKEAITYTPIPSKNNLYSNVNKLTQVRGSLILLDNLSYASSLEQVEIQGFIDSKTYRDVHLPNCSINFTGHNHIDKIISPLLSRALVFEVKNTLAATFNSEKIATIRDNIQEHKVTTPKLV